MNISSVATDINAFLTGLQELGATGFEHTSKTGHMESHGTVSQDMKNRYEGYTRSEQRHSHSEKKWTWSNKKPQKGAANQYKKPKTQAKGGGNSILDQAADVAERLGIRGEKSVSGEFQATGYQTDINFRTEGDWGYFDMKNKVTIGEVRGQGSATVGYKKGNLHAQAQVSAQADLFRVDSKVDAKINGVGTLQAQGTAKIGADGAAQARIQMGKDGLHAEGNMRAFVGAEAKASGEMRFENGAVLRGSAAAKVGIGAEIGGKIGYKDGKLDFQFNIGLALGIGASFSFGFSVDFNKMGEWINKNLGPVGKAITDFGSSVAKVAGDVVDTVKKVGDGISKAFKGVGDFFKGLFG